MNTTAPTATASTYGQLIRARRLSMGFATQRALAEEIGVTVWTIGQIEGGQTPSLPTITAIATALECTIDDLTPKPPAA